MSTKRLRRRFCCGSLGPFCTGSSCRTSCKLSPRFPTLSSWSSNAACLISKSSCSSKNLTTAKWRCLKSSLYSLNLRCSLLAANWSAGDRLSFASSYPNLLYNLVMEARITPRRRRLPQVSSFAIPDISKAGNRSYLYGTAIDLRRKNRGKGFVLDPVQRINVQVLTRIE